MNSSVDDILNDIDDVLVENDDVSDDVEDISTGINDISSIALDLQSQINTLTKQLDEYKDKLRSMADGSNMKVEIPNKGVVSISKPRSGSSKEVMSINEKAISDELAAKLIDKNIIIKETKITNPARASVSIKPNI